MLVFTAFSNINGIFILIKWLINFIRMYYYRLHLKNSYVSPSLSSSVKVFFTCSDEGSCSSGWQPACTDSSDAFPSGLDWPICLWFLSQLASVISTEKTAPESSWLLKMNQTKFLITSMYNFLPRGSLKVPFASWGQSETFLRLSGICFTSSAPAPGWSPAGCGSLYWTLPFPLTLLSLYLFWFK